jgi:hypothetical protein
MATIKRKIKVRQGTASTRPTLASGEIGFDTDTYGVWIGDGTTNRPMGIPVKKYVAIVSQSSTNAPSATVLENTLGETPSFAYGDVGQYTCTLTLDTSKTVVRLTPKSLTRDIYVTTTTNTITIYSFAITDHTTGANGWGAFLEILVYP